MDTQEIYDKVVNHLRAQGNPWGHHFRRAWTYVNPHDPCQRCAKGILMDVEKNESGMYFPNDISLGNYNYYPDIIQMLGALEICFENFEVIDWEKEFVHIAQVHGLEYKAAKEIKQDKKEVRKDVEEYINV